MKFLRSILTLSLLVFFVSAKAQVTLIGLVTDSTTGEPLRGASVFCQNTTSGTLTAADGSFSLGIEKGGYDLIITFTGYQTRVLPIHTDETGFLRIALQREEQSMEEVIIQSSNEVKDGWEKYGDFFLSYFIGNTPFSQQCTLENPDSLRFFFYRKSNRLKVLARSPLVITNRALGYSLSYTLDSFVYHYNTDQSSYRGYCLFTDLKDSTGISPEWEKNRSLAYHGSKMHFMRAYYNAQLKEEGFRIALLRRDDEHRFNEVTDPYHDSYYYYDDSTGEAEIWYPRKISITYLNQVPENEYLKQYGLPMDVGVQTTYSDILEPIIIKSNGYYYRQSNWIDQGYWSWKNLADLLPYNYEP